MNAQPTPSAPFQRILIVTLAEVGDALLATPALRALREAYPAAHISMLTTPAGAAVLRDLPWHNEMILFDKHRFDVPLQAFTPSNVRYAWQLWRRLHTVPYDACLILHHLSLWFGTLKYAALAYASGAQRRFGLDNGRGFFLTDRVRDAGFGAQHQVEYGLEIVRLLGVPVDQLSSDMQQPAFDPGPIRLDIAATLNDSRPIVALHPGSGGFAPARRWPPARFAALADAIIADGAQLVLVGGKEEAALRQSVLGAMRHAADVLDIGGQTTLSELAGVLQRCTLFVGNDSGVAHLAGSVGTPVVSIFGPTDPRAWGPYGGVAWQQDAELANGVGIWRSGTHRALKASIACSPCIYRGHQRGARNGCPDRTCLLRIDEAHVLAVIRQRLREVFQPCVSTT